uniref:Large ribosomal subunit protein mL64 n=1 Tax=Strigamia maritima TaxID=126957 RepID=T1J5P6_STRMM
MALGMLTCMSVKNIVNIKTLNRFNTLNLFKNEVRLCSSKGDNEGENVDPETEIDKLRNVSRMKPHLRKALLRESMQFKDTLPYENWWVTSYKQKIIKAKYFGKYGVESGVEPGILWPNREELEKIKAEEKEFYPSLQEMMANVKKEKEEMAEKTRLRVLEVDEKMKKLDGWIKDLDMRKQKKLDDAKAQKDKKEKLLEEVRAHFGYVVDPQDEKFKELLAEKEKEEKIAKKEAKKKEYIAKELAKMQMMSEKAMKEKAKKEGNGAKEGQLEEENFKESGKIK